VFFRFASLEDDRNRADFIMKCSPDITGQIGAFLAGVAVPRLANGVNLWMYWLSEFLGASVAAVFFLVVDRERLHERLVASHDRAQEQANQSTRAL
jgi:hypothetical protein